MHAQLRVLFRARWPRLTEVDLERANGQVPRLAALLQDKYGYGRRRAERELLDFFDELLGRVRRVGAAATASVP